MLLCITLYPLNVQKQLRKISLSDFFFFSWHKDANTSQCAHNVVLTSIRRQNVCVLGLSEISKYFLTELLTNNLKVIPKFLNVQKLSPFKSKQSSKELSKTVEYNMIIPTIFKVITKPIEKVLKMLSS